MPKNNNFEMSSILSQVIYLEKAINPRLHIYYFISLNLLHYTYKVLSSILREVANSNGRREYSEFQNANIHVIHVILLHFESSPSSYILILQ